MSISQLPEIVLAIFLMIIIAVLAYGFGYIFPFLMDKLIKRCNEGEGCDRKELFERENNCEIIYSTRATRITPENDHQETRILILHLFDVGVSVWDNSCGKILNSDRLCVQVKKEIPEIIIFLARCETMYRVDLSHDPPEDLISMAEKINKVNKLYLG